MKDFPGELFESQVEAEARDVTFEVLIAPAIDVDPALEFVPSIIHNTGTDLISLGSTAYYAVCQSFIAPSDSMLDSITLPPMRYYGSSPAPDIKLHVGVWRRNGSMLGKRIWSRLNAVQVPFGGAFDWFQPTVENVELPVVGGAQYSFGFWTSDTYDSFHAYMASDIPNYADGHFHQVELSTMSPTTPVYSSAFDLRFELQFKPLITYVYTDQIKNIEIQRDASSSNETVFAGAIGADCTITLGSDRAILPIEPTRKIVEIRVGLAGENIAILRGPLRDYQRSANEQETTIRVGDMSALFIRNDVEATPLFDVNSSVYIRQLLEAAGVTARAFTEESILMAVDFDADDSRAIVRRPPDADSNVVNNATPRFQLPASGLDEKPYMFENSNHSQALVASEDIVGPGIPDAFMIAPKNTSSFMIWGDSFSSLEWFEPLNGHDGWVVTGTGTCEGWSQGVHIYGSTISMSRMMGDKPLDGVFRTYMMVRSFWGSTRIRIMGDNGVAVDLMLEQYSGSDFGRIYYYDQNNVKTLTSLAFPYGDPEWGGSGFLLHVDLNAFTDHETGLEWVMVSVNDNPDTAVPVSFKREGSTRFEQLVINAYGNDSIWFYWIDVGSSGGYHALNSTYAWGQFFTTDKPMALDEVFLGLEWLGHDSTVEVRIGTPQGSWIYASTIAKDQNTVNTGWYWENWPDPPVLTPGNYAIWAYTTLPVQAGNSVRIMASSGYSGEYWDDAFIMDAPNGGIITRFYGGNLVFDIDPNFNVSLYYHKASITWDSPDPIVHTIDGTEFDIQSILENGGVFSYGGFFKLLEIPTSPVLLMTANFRTADDFPLQFPNDQAGVFFIAYEPLLGGASGKIWAGIIDRDNQYTAINADSRSIIKTLIAGTEYFIGVNVKIVSPGSSWYASFEIQVDDELHDYLSTSNVPRGLAGWTAFRGISIIELPEYMIKYYGDYRPRDYANEFFPFFSESFASGFKGIRYDNLFVAAGLLDGNKPVAQYSLDKGFNQISAAAFYGDIPWNEIRSVAESELGFVHVDGDGLYRFRNRHYYLGSMEVPDKTISDESSLIDATLIEGEGNIRNSLRMRIYPRTPIIRRTIWELKSAMVIPSYSTLEFTIELPGIILAMDSVPSSVHVASRSRYRAAVVSSIEPDGEAGSAGGAEEHISFDILPVGRVVHITVSNSYNRSVVLNDGSGAPYFYLFGSMIQDTIEDSQQRTWMTVEDSESIEKYGRRGTEIEFKFVANSAQAEALSSILLHRHQKGIVQIENVKIPGDARLEIADEVVLEFSRWDIDGNYIVESIKDYLGPNSGHLQTLSLMQAETLTSGSWFMLDESELDTNNALAI